MIRPGTLYIETLLLYSKFIPGSCSVINFVKRFNNISTLRYFLAFKKKAIIQRWFLAFTPKEVLKADSFMDVATRFCG